MPRSSPTASLLPAIVAMALLVTASNVLVQYLVGDWLTWGAFTYPFAFLVTDLTNRIHGAGAARRVVLAGFATGIVCSFIAAGLDKTTIRIATASGTAFLAAQLTDVAVFNRYRAGRWWTAPFVSTLVGSALDTTLFFTIAFWSMLTVFGPAETEAALWASEAVPLLGHGPVLPLWMSLGLADWSVKLALAVVALIPFRLVVRGLGSQPG